ncbi:MAG TPA: YbaB/EbfC family nucleoid-associated protein [Clostridiales bacterium]|nr:YbaB/EbfC family nucleoid-associated protein [Clostridiales bacterium]
MAKGGFPGMGNMNQIMRQAKKMQEQMEAIQKELEEQTVETTVGGGMVTVVANGKREILSIDIKPEVVDPDDIEMLQDLVIAAVNEALRQVDEMASEKMGQFTGGLGIPGLF